MTTPSRLDRRDARRPKHTTQCPAVFPDQKETQCEGVKDHDGPHVARVTVTWETPRGKT